MTKLWLLPALFLTACDAGPVVNDSFVVDLGGAFDNTLVRIEVDGDEVFEDRVTTGAILATAGGVDVYVPVGRHLVRATVEGRATGEIDIDTETIVTLVVNYNPESDSVSFRPLDHPVFHR